MIPKANSEIIGTASLVSKWDRMPSSQFEQIRQKLPRASWGIGLPGRALLERDITATVIIKTSLYLLLLIITQNWTTCLTY